MRLPDRSYRCSKPWCILLSALLVVSSAMGQDALDRNAYLTRIAELQQKGPDIARTQGKEALIRQYRTLIDENPDYANNIQLETQIGLIYESDLSDSGEPPNMQAAYNQYVGIIDTYDPSNPYMKQVRQMAADRAVQLDPAAAEDLYWGMIEDYPDDPTVVLSSYYKLGQLAEQNGDPAAARELYEEVMNHAPSDDALSETERAIVQQYEANAVLNLMAREIRQARTPEERLAVVQSFLDKYPELSDTQSDLIDRLLKSIETMGEREGSRTELREAVRSLVALLQQRRDEDEAAPPEARASGQQERTMAASEDQPTIGGRQGGRGSRKEVASGSAAQPGERGEDSAQPSGEEPPSPTVALKGHFWVLPAIVIAAALVAIGVVVAKRRKS